MAGCEMSVSSTWCGPLTRPVGLAIRREGALAALVLAVGSLAPVAFARLPALQAIVGRARDH